MFILVLKLIQSGVEFLFKTAHLKTKFTVSVLCKCFTLRQIFLAKRDKFEMKRLTDIH